MTEYSSNLIHANESGALNESYSDIFGTLVEFWAQPDDTSSYPNSAQGHADWLIGEATFLDDSIRRSMRNPEDFEDPSVYYGTYWKYGLSYYGGVHDNNGVLNHAFYLLPAGGSGSNDGISYSISGFGIDRARQIAMNANLYYQTLTDDYIDARRA